MSHDSSQSRILPGIGLHVHFKAQIYVYVLPRNKETEASIGCTVFHVLSQQGPLFCALFNIII